MWRFVTAWQSIFVKWQGAQWRVSLSVSGDKYRHNNCIFLHVTVRDTNLHEVDQFSHPLHHSKSTYTCGQMCEVLRGDVSVAHAGHAGHTLLSLQHSHHCGLLLIWVSLDTGLCPLYCHTVLTLCSLLCPASNWAQSPVSLRHSPGTNRSGPGLYRHGGLRGHSVWHRPCAAYNLNWGKQIKT